jgi:hypothetical protein
MPFRWAIIVEDIFQFGDAHLGVGGHMANRGYRHTVLVVALVLSVLGCTSVVYNGALLSHL